MAKLHITVKSRAPLSQLEGEVKTVVVKINTAPVRLTTIKADVSAQPDNIITQQPDGLYAVIDKPDNILNFIASFDAAITKG